MKDTDADNVALTEWLELKEDKKGLFQCVIDSIDVYAEKAIEIKWKYRDSFTGMLTEKLWLWSVSKESFIWRKWGFEICVITLTQAGHDLGNHSENHKNMSQLSDQEKKDELMKVHTKVQELTGYEMFLFRPPYGDYDNAVVNVAKDCGYYTIQWDVDTLDT